MAPRIEIIAAGIISRSAGRGAFMPTITPFADGTLIAAQHVGESLGSSDNHIEVLRSGDGGRTWINEGGIHPRNPPCDGYCYRGPHVHPVPDGRLVMTAGRFEVADYELFDAETEALQRPAMLLFWSSDQGHSWSEPQVVPVDFPPERYTCNGAGGLFQLAPDRWMYPFETWKPSGYEGPPDQKAGAVFSADQGRTWGELNVIADDPSGELLWWDQRSCVLPDGRIYTLLWTHVYGTSEDLNTHWVISEDQGRTWSDPRPTTLRGQVSTPIALPDGRVATIYNHRHEPQGIRVAVTGDLTNYDADGGDRPVRRGCRGHARRARQRQFPGRAHADRLRQTGWRAVPGRRCDDLLLVHDRRGDAYPVDPAAGALTAGFGVLSCGRCRPSR